MVCVIANNRIAQVPSGRNLSNADSDILPSSASPGAGMGERARHLHTIGTIVMCKDCWPNDREHTAASAPLPALRPTCPTPLRQPASSMLRFALCDGVVAVPRDVAARSRLINGLLHAADCAVDGRATSATFSHLTMAAFTRWVSADVDGAHEPGDLLRLCQVRFHEFDESRAPGRL